MTLTDPAHRSSAGARRAGYCIAIAFSAALLIVLNGRPGRQAMPFLTSDTGQVLWLFNLSLAAGIAANFVYLAYDPPWVRSLGDLATTGIGLATAIASGRCSPSPCHRAGRLPCVSCWSWPSQVRASRW